ncbi:MAG: retroviral-like aspartic protease family protein [Parabacteroides sp.]|nr:retroviral-like aspartic protease family protein [Parabacteroides sp.]
MWMIKYKFNILLKSLLFGLLLQSCNNKPTPIYIDMGYSSTDMGDDEIKKEDSSSFLETDKVCVVPYREEAGIKIIEVKVNGIGLDMIFDTGCSGTLISIAEADYLFQKGLLTEKDFLGLSKSKIADGSIVENMVINLKEVIIADQIICHDVVATVSNNISAPLLLGNEVLNRSASFTIDNVNKTITFKLK